MSLFSSIKNLIFDFLFPRSSKILELESLPIDTLIKILPQANRLEDKMSLALFDYSHPLVKEIIWQIKYSGNTKITEKIGAILYDAILGDLEDLELFSSTNWQKQKPILMPIPISDKRRFERGWNQAELLAEALIACDHRKLFKYIPRQLNKTHHTESQTKTSSRRERLKNLTDSMQVANPASIANSCIIILDDVTTTGSTFAEARRALRKAGVKEILCIAIAH